METEPNPTKSNELTDPTGIPRQIRRGQRRPTRTQRPIAGIDRPIRGAIPLPHQTPIIPVRLPPHVQPQHRRGHRRPIRQRRGIKAQQPYKHLVIAKCRTPRHRKERAHPNRRHRPHRRIPSRLRLINPRITIITISQHTERQRPRRRLRGHHRRRRRRRRRRAGAIRRRHHHPHPRPHIRTRQHIRTRIPPHIHTRPTRRITTTPLIRKRNRRRPRPRPRRRRHRQPLLRRPRHHRQPRIRRRHRRRRRIAHHELRLGQAVLERGQPANSCQPRAAPHSGATATRVDPVLDTEPNPTKIERAHRPDRDPRQIRRGQRRPTRIQRPIATHRSANSTPPYHSPPTPDYPHPPSPSHATATPPTSPSPHPATPTYQTRNNPTNT